MEYKDSKKNIIDELEKIDSSILYKWKKNEQRSELPEGYLDTLYESIVHQKSTKIVKMNSRHLIWSVAASIFIGLVSITFFVRSSDVSMDTIDTQEIYSYLIETESINSTDLTLISALTDQIEDGSLLNDDMIMNYLEENLEEIEYLELNSF